MEQLIELLKQIQDLAGVAVDALEKAGGKGGEHAAPGGEPDKDESAAGAEPPGPEEKHPGM